MTQTTDPTALELGLDTFGDVTADSEGRLLPQGQVLRDLVDEAVLADELGIDFIGIGEHHRADFAVSAPEIVMAAIAARTRRIRIGTAVTVLSSDDPVRLFQRAATLDALSEGRSELILGRGSFTESFPLFGQDLSDYEVLFEEKLDLFTRLIRDDTVTWQGRTRAGLKGATVHPRPERPLRAWIGVGGSPESVIRAVSHELPLMLAVIGGDPRRFRPFVDLWHRAWDQVGKPALPVGIHSPGHVGPTDDEAKERFWPGYKKMHDLIGGSRGWPPLRREDFEREIAHGSLYVGGPETVAKKIAATVRALGVSRFDLKYSAGPQLPSVLQDGIRLYGEQVVPMVRDLLA
ncbi:LLM class flavin-dependent oxidoreductase [Frigidibacter oleivorans]|uniref:LLM class flavin-dependent oxidoreductase n=1 Tax=Frigidibacter oleivorans TaxID=2487129 RepID=UPI000F8E1BD6|nr:LLM class flavin-dependent oxidoreductase [Frigidibacter oleivorans]